MVKNTPSWWKQADSFNQFISLPSINDKCVSTDVFGNLLDFKSSFCSHFSLKEHIRHDFRFTSNTDLQIDKFNIFDHFFQKYIFQTNDAHRLMLLIEQKRMKNLKINGPPIKNIFLFDLNTDNLYNTLIKIQSQIDILTLQYKNNFLNNDEYISTIDKYEDKLNNLPKNNLVKYLKKTELKKDQKINVLKESLSNWTPKRTTMTNSYRIFPTEKQQIKIHKWITECNKIYDACLDEYNKNKYYFDGFFTMKNKKADFFKKIYGDEVNNKPTPYDILSFEISRFITNVASATTNKKNKNIKKFTLKKRSEKIRIRHTFGIPKACIKIDENNYNEKNGFYISHLGPMKGMENLKIKKNIIQESIITYDSSNGKYELKLAHKRLIKNKLNKQPVVAIDPGINNFIAYYGLKEHGQIGKIDLKKKILEYQEKIKQMQKIQKKNKNKNKTRIKHPKKIQKKIKSYYKKIKDLVKEVHTKAASFLCKKYENILLPEFETQDMLKKPKTKKEKEIKAQQKLNKPKTKKEWEAIRIKKGEVEYKKEIKQVRKKRYLSKKDKFVMNMQAHYKFKLYLKSKSLEYGSKVHDVTEEYTSKTCTCCGHMSDEYVNRMKTCTYCRIKIDRDTNGSRNILIKNMFKIIKHPNG